MSEALVGAMPVDGWTTDDLDAMPVTNIRYELTDGAVTVTPSPANLHQHLRGGWPPGWRPRRPPGSRW